MTQTARVVVPLIALFTEELLIFSVVQQNAQALHSRHLPYGNILFLRRFSRIGQRREPLLHHV